MNQTTTSPETIPANITAEGLSEDKKFSLWKDAIDR